MEQGQQGGTVREESSILGGLKKVGGLFWTNDEKPDPAPAAATLATQPTAVVHQYVPAPAVVDPEAVKAIERKLGTLSTPGLTKMHELLQQLGALDEANRFKAVEALLGGQGITRAKLLGEIDKIDGELNDIGTAFERSLGRKVDEAKQASVAQTGDLTGRINAINQQIETLNAQAVELEAERDVAERAVARAEEECTTKRAGFMPALGKVDSDNSSLRALITRYLNT